MLKEQNGTEGSQWAKALSADIAVMVQGELGWPNLPD